LSGRDGIKDALINYSINMHTVSTWQELIRKILYAMQNVRLTEQPRK